MNSGKYYLILLCALVTALAACSSGDRQSQTATGYFDADIYRAQIVAIESILYKSSPPEYNDGSAAGAMMRNLCDSLTAHSSNPLAQNRAMALIMISDTGDSDVGYSAPDLSRLRNVWEETRLDLFGEHPWFRTVDSAVLSGQTPVSPEADMRYVDRLSRAMGRLDRLMEWGREECESLGEPDYEPERPGQRGNAQYYAWVRFSNEWREKLDHAVSFLPKPTPETLSNQDYAMASQYVSQAIGQLRILTVGVGDYPTPFRHNWESRLDGAEQKLAEAREALARIDP